MNLFSMQLSTKTKTKTTKKAKAYSIQFKIDFFYFYYFIFNVPIIIVQQCIELFVNIRSLVKQNNKNITQEPFILMIFYEKNTKNPRNLEIIIFSNHSSNHILFKKRLYENKVDLDLALCESKYQFIPKILGVSTVAPERINWRIQQGKPASVHLEKTRKHREPLICRGQASLLDT